MLKSETSSRLVGFSIQSKMLIFFVAIVLLSIGSGLYFALDLFYRDKSAYIFETSLAKSVQLSDSVKEYFRYLAADAEVFSHLIKNVEEQQQLQKLLDRKKDILQITVFSREEQHWKPALELLSTNVKERSPQVVERISSVDDLKELIKQDIKPGSLSLYFHLDYDPAPFVTMFIKPKNGQELLMFKVAGQPLKNLFLLKSSAFKSFLIDGKNKFILFQDPKLTQQSITTFIKEKQVLQGVFDFNLNQAPFLLAFDKIPKLELTLVTIISKDAAFKAVRSLVEKSLAIGFLILSLSLALGVMISRSITRPIDELMAGTRRLAAGDFVSKVRVDTKDEFLTLGESFNFMSSEILRFTNEIKDKVRMEEELAVAQLVQSSFFPYKDVTFGRVSVSGFYQSASECGGDWWGVVEIQGKKLVMIGDATGHGVPAALITATANCCAQLLKELAQNRPEMLQRPSLILSMMNQVVHQLGGKILMTFFLGIVDEENNTLTYSNASHNSPYVYRYSEDEPSKDRIEVLTEAIGTRLGHTLETTYETTSVSFNPEDVLVLYTDGVTESENPEGKQYGERRFIKSLLRVAKQGAPEIASKLIEDAYDYYQDIPPNDDVTLVVIKLEKQG